jgi:hypothetical protein
MVVATGKPIPMESLQRSPTATPSPGSTDRPSLHCCERNSPVKNRMPEIGASGTVRVAPCKAYGSQPSEMAAAAKSSQQPRTESCVVAGYVHCEA